MAVVDLRYPFRGRWLVRRSPANRVPSHGTRLYGTTYAIDFVPVDDEGRSAAFTRRAQLRPQPPEEFTGFGRPLLAPCSGAVVAAHGEEPDHDAFRGLPSVVYALAQQQRAGHGWPGLAGNHVIIETAGEVLVALCHLRQGSLAVPVGQAVGVGDVMGQCGNTGNSTEPHVHVQAMDRLDVENAIGLPITFGGELPRNDTVVDVP
ncbi:MAG TPA: M23 family metallopeptidase [Ornithinimicrobium sp.]|uniref:M23 family metallopeptidase n=1 Tax=Ornithinimicrobium sp. TaxID=1977084 RepID=UPI002B49A93D|nr:M23 family metallopeptidase [Ornithinimicrobium sp.]HKJ12397.1 M23 family metallopeptidase [Ornithinimicrobium sp.]